ncbi:hypothetical protein [Magnetospirillum sp. SS-4]|jgi:hypothetical protein|uniref:hypothetical protein n=1 Tax=Magnetospirillum sp. SS-4 TaxID=2681465 RepID=UPI00137E7662|nr:hypothetical protein [Magnetospirillum sp. SS-4]CAA7624051.1 conserved exported hypothetical protein [Magnetospirillum sp. SS-4]
MSRQTATFSSSAGSRTFVRSTVAGAGGAVAAGTAKAAGFLTMGKMAGVGLGALAGGPLGAAVAVGLMAGLIYGSAAARPRRV